MAMKLSHFKLEELDYLCEIRWLDSSMVRNHSLTMCHLWSRKWRIHRNSSYVETFYMPSDQKCLKNFEPPSRAPMKTTIGRLREVEPHGKSGGTSVAGEGHHWSLSKDIQIGHLHPPSICNPFDKSSWQAWHLSESLRSPRFAPLIFAFWDVDRYQILRQNINWRRAPWLRVWCCRKFFPVPRKNQTNIKSSWFSDLRFLPRDIHNKCLFVYPFTYRCHKATTPATPSRGPHRCWWKVRDTLPSQQLWAAMTTMVSQHVQFWILIGYPSKTTIPFPVHSKSTPRKRGLVGDEIRSLGPYNRGVQYERRMGFWSFSWIVDLSPQCFAKMKNANSQTPSTKPKAMSKSGFQPTPLRTAKPWLFF